MNKIIVLCLILIITSISKAQIPNQGRSTGGWTAPCGPRILENKKCGIKYIEIGLNAFCRNLSLEKTEPMMLSMKKSIDSTDIKVWSAHLPFSKTLDISVINDSLRAQNIAYMLRIIQLCFIFQPKKLVLHPSSEPINDEEREQRLINSLESIDTLRKAANRIGAQLCIENLPRTCLGRNSQEIKRLTENFPDVAICFDTNHLIGETSHDFIQSVGRRIGTIHISDYDFVDEKHWLPGKGQIKWGALCHDLLESGYKGVFMFECRDTGAKELRDSYKHIVREYKTFKKGDK